MATWRNFRFIKHILTRGWKQNAGPGTRVSTCQPLGSQAPAPSLPHGEGPWKSNSDFTHQPIVSNWTIKVKPWVSFSSLWDFWHVSGKHRAAAVFCAGRIKHITHKRWKRSSCSCTEGLLPLGVQKELTASHVSFSNKTTNQSKSKNAFKSKEASRTFNSLSGFTCTWFSHQKSEPLLKKN